MRSRIARGRAAVVKLRARTPRSADLSHGRTLELVAIPEFQLAGESVGKGSKGSKAGTWKTWREGGKKGDKA